MWLFVWMFTRVPAMQMQMKSSLALAIPTRFAIYVALRPN